MAFDFHNWLMAQWRRLSWILQKRLWKQRRDRSPQQNTKGRNKHGRSRRPPVVEGRSDAYGTGLRSPTLAHPPANQLTTQAEAGLGVGDVGKGDEEEDTDEGFKAAEKLYAFLL